MPFFTRKEMLRKKRDYYESRGSDYLNSESPVSREDSNLPTHNHDDRYFTKEQQNATQEIIDNKQIEQDGRLATLETDVDTLQTDVMNKAALEHMHPEATTGQAGFMSAADKTKLNQAITSAPVTSVNGQTGTVVLDSADVGAATSGHTHAEATVSSAGFMSALDKEKLDSLGKTLVYAYATASQSIPASTTTKINYGGERYDNNSEFIAATGTFTAKTAGFFFVKAYFENNLHTGLVSGSHARMFLNLYKNGAESTTLGATIIPYNNLGAVFGSAVIELDVGDTLDIRVWCNYAFTNRARGANYDYVNIIKLF
jgi:hypothetical protein